MSGRWSEEAWTAAQPVYEKILEHPFVVALSDGTLSNERFRYYISQDALYLESYSAVLSHIASRLNDREDVEAFLRFASDGIAVERALHESFFSGCEQRETEKSPVCILYTSILKSQAYAPVEVEVAAVLPCFWIYQMVGKAIIEKNSNRESNPYNLWIDAYADETFEASTVRAIEICDKLAQNASETTRKMMTDIFLRCAKMEWMFWNSAWNLEKWEI